jgi:small neutral amino acid transporter SnatA (MarC family)
MLASALLLAKGHRIGYHLGGIMLVKTSVLGFALMAMAVSMYLQGLNPDYFQVLLWCVIGLVGSSLSFFFLRGLKLT